VQFLYNFKYTHPSLTDAATKYRIPSLLLHSKSEPSSCLNLHPLSSEHEVVSKMTLKFSWMRSLSQR
jgi:hypothetical protein